MRPVPEPCVSNPNTPTCRHHETLPTPAGGSACTGQSGAHTFGRRQYGFPTLSSIMGAVSQNRPRRHDVPHMPESYILLGQVSLIPLVGIAAALIASRVPSLRADT